MGPGERLDATELRVRLAAGGPIRLIDLRGGKTFRAAHLRGAVSVPRIVLERRLFLLPPRPRALCLLHPKIEVAQEAATLLRERGWRDVSWSTEMPRTIGLEWIEEGDTSARLWEPTPFLEDAAELMPRGDARALDLACGSGRNAAYLALLGWEAFGVDLLPDALQQARILSRASRAKVGFHVADLTTPAAIARWLAPGSWDALLCFRYLDRALFPAMRRAVRPGGCVVMETFLEEQARVHGKPSRPAHLLRPGELHEVFRDWEILLWREGVDESGNFFSGVVARRPMAIDA